MLIPYCGKSFGNIFREAKMKYHVIVFLLVCGFAGQVFAQPHLPTTSMPITIPDVQVITQSGERVPFNQIVKGRIAIVTGFFTTCTSMCPITQEKLARVAKLLGQRVGKDVIIVSLSVDPENDTPARMKAWAEQFHIGQGWVLASGDKKDMENLLKSFGLFVDGIQRHQSALMIGSNGTGWMRVSSWTPTDKMAGLVERLASSGRQEAAGLRH
jgi:cytochrome oxidase Cu insertion factor (SCO1/SenC/PrrC family)